MSKLQCSIREVMSSGGNVLVEYKKGTNVSTFVTMGINVTGYSKLLPMVHAKVDDVNLQKLLDNPDVLKVWRDEEVTTLEVRSNEVSPFLNDSLPLIEVDKIHALGIKGKGVVVGVVDTGVDKDHPDLEGRVIKRAHTIGDNDEDKHGHGTHCAGIIGGNGSKFKGMAPECSIISIKVLNDSGGGTLSSVMNGIEWLLEEDLHKVDVISLSLGASMVNTDGSDPLSQMCGLAVKRGKVVIAAAGNSGPKSGSICSPACREEVIAVGSSTKADKLSTYSSRGPTSDDRIKPEICAPGQDIVSLRAYGTSMGKPIDKLYTVASGTSMACPHIAGIAALMIQRYGLAPIEFKISIMDTALDILRGGKLPDSLPDNNQGAGRVEAFIAFDEYESIGNVYTLNVKMEPIVDDSWIVEGTITSKATDESLEGVEVTMKGETVTSGLDGKWGFLDVPIGEYVLEFKKEGYTDASIAFKLPPNKPGSSPESHVEWVTSSTFSFQFGL